MSGGGTSGLSNFNQIFLDQERNIIENLTTLEQAF
jgi:hypothetical protein